jgi:hypothetical protein
MPATARIAVAARLGRVLLVPAMALRSIWAIVTLRKDEATHEPTGSQRSLRGTVAYRFLSWAHPPTKAHPAEAGAAKPRVPQALRDVRHKRHEGPPRPPSCRSETRFVSHPRPCVPDSAHHGSEPIVQSGRVFGFRVHAYDQPRRARLPRHRNPRGPAALVQSVARDILHPPSV